MEIIKKRMKDKTLYQRRTDGDYKGYTEDSFYFNSTEQLWCWKQTSTGEIFKAKTINDLSNKLDNIEEKADEVYEKVKKKKKDKKKKKKKDMKRD